MFRVPREPVVRRIGGGSVHSMTIDQACRTPLGELVGILKNLS